MRGWPVTIAASTIVAAIVSAGCGKKGPPLPPLRPVPARVADLTAVRTDGRVTLHLTIPNANADGTTPVVISRIEVYRTVTPPAPPASATTTTAATTTPAAAPVGAAPAGRGAAPASGRTTQAGAASAPTTAAGGRGRAAGPAAPVASTIAANPKNLLTTVAVRPAPVEEKDTDSSKSESTSGDTSKKNGAKTPAPKPAKPLTPEEAAKPMSGTAITIVDEILPAALAVGGARNYVVVPVAGSGHGRAGAASAVVTVALGDLPDAPPAPRLTYDEQHLTATWDPVAGEVFSVIGAATAAEIASAPPLTPEPIAAATFVQPVQFDKPVCLALRASRVTGPVRVDSSASPAACVTPVDTFPPPAPTGLQAVQEGAAVTLLWNRMDLPDLGGYIVLRGDAAGGALQPLMRTPIQDVTYRDETVRPGQAYTYAVYAVDKAPTPNVSPLSERQSLVVR